MTDPKSSTDNMSWDEPDDNGGRGKRDPWGAGGNGGRKDGPPELDEIAR